MKSLKYYVIYSVRIKRSYILIKVFKYLVNKIENFNGIVRIVSLGCEDFVLNVLSFWVDEYFMYWYDFFELIDFVGLFMLYLI